MNITSIPEIFYLNKKYEPIFRDKSVSKKNLNKGIILERREICSFIRTVTGKIIEMLLNQNDNTKINNYIEEQLSLLRQNKIPLNKLIYKKKFGCYRDDSLHHMKIFINKQNLQVKAGDIIEYLIIENPDAIHLGEKMVLPDQYKDKNSSYVLDLEWYELQLMKFIEPLFNFQSLNE